MNGKLKTHTDVGIDNPTISCTKAEDKARQEFKEEADVNYMLSRFGITPTRGAPTYGEWDDTIDLQSALQSLHDARTAYRDLPENLRNKFTRMEDLLAALENGSLVIKNEDAPAEPAPTPTVEERLAAVEKTTSTAPVKT